MASALNEVRDPTLAIDGADARVTPPPRYRHALSSVPCRTVCEVARTLLGSASSSVRPETIDGSETDIVVLCPSSPDACALSAAYFDCHTQRLTDYKTSQFYRRMFAA